MVRERSRLVRERDGQRQREQEKEREGGNLVVVGFVSNIKSMNCEVGIRTVNIKEMYYRSFRCYRLIFDFWPIQCTFLLREVSHTVYTMHWAVYIIQYTVYGIYVHINVVSI